MRKFGRSTSDYAQEHFFSFENIMDMAVDSFMQLRQQRLIAEIPKRIGMTKAADTAIEAEAQRILTRNPQLAKYFRDNPEDFNSLLKASEVYRNSSKVFENATKVSTAVSRAYLITTSTEDVYNMSREYGFDPQTSSMISLATYAGIGALFQTDYFRGILYNTPDYELRRDIKALTRAYLRNNAEEITKSVATAGDQATKLSLLKRFGKNLSDFLKNHITNVESGRFGVVEGAISEALEEVSEEGAQDIAFQIGKG